jgi:hypothetical protein
VIKEIAIGMDKEKAAVEPSTAAQNIKAKFEC